MRESFGASSSKSKSSSGSGNNPVAARAPPAKKKGGKRGAPQTFASKLFNVLQAAEGKKGSPVSWCLEGNSFTVHNDKDFETQVLTANYRHGKFSSFQRQLNMYGFRKVADCSDRTYSHPFFRRDQSDLLAQVRRVVNDTVGAANASATFSPSGNPVVKRPAHELAPSIRRPKQQQAGGRKSESADNGESGGGGGVGSRRPPARKKARRSRDVTPSTSAVSTATMSATGGGLRPKLASGGGEAVGSASPRGDGDSNSTVFPAPSQQQQQQQQQQPGRAAAAAIASTTPAAQQTRHAPRPWPQQHQQHQHQHQRVNEEQLHHQQRPLSAQQVAAGQRNPSLQEFSSVWSRHTGRWDVPALDGSSLGDDGGTWTTASSSAASSVEEAVSPVLLPTTPASLDCSKSFVPPFRLQQDVSPSLADMCRRNGYGGHPASSSGAQANTFGPSNLVLVSPAPVMFGGGGGGCGGPDAEVDVLNGRRGDPMPPSTAATFARSSPAMMYHSEAQGPVGQDAPGGGLYITGGGTGWRGGGGRGDEGGILPADKAGHGPTLTRCPSFDKIFGRQDPHSSSHGNQPGMAQLDNPRTAKPGAAIDTGNAVVPISPTASANAAADGWDLACLGGAGWGSPDTTESPAAEVWAAIPPLIAQESCERGVSPRPSPFGEAGGVGSVYQQQQQQQHAGPYNRTLSPPPAYPLTVAGGGAGRKGEASVGGGAVATDPLSWSVLGEDAAKAGTRLGYADEGLMMATGGGGVVRRASPPFSTMPPPGVAPLG
ncbi:unnamed protein product [Ectocarpus sp. 13 AM-2016]